jgi:hypothetical protein
MAKDVGKGKITVKSWDFIPRVMDSQPSAEEAGEHFKRSCWIILPPLVVVQSVIVGLLENEGQGITYEILLLKIAQICCLIHRKQ